MISADCVRPVEHRAVECELLLRYAAAGHRSRREHIILFEEVVARIPEDHTRIQCAVEQEILQYRLLRFHLKGNYRNIKLKGKCRCAVQGHDGDLPLQAGRVYATACSLRRPLIAVNCPHVGTGDTGQLHCSEGDTSTAHIQDPVSVRDARQCYFVTNHSVVQPRVQARQQRNVPGVLLHLRYEKRN